MKVQKDLMEKTGGKLNRKTLIDFQNWYMNQYDSFDVLRKYYTYTRAFLEYVYKVTGNPSPGTSRTSLTNLRGQARRSTRSSSEKMT